MGFGPALKDWRKRRGFSQEALGFEANVSARHIAFIETGRARPSREMVVRLSEALDVPRADRNAMLEAAGFAAIYRARNLDEAEMGSITQGIRWILDRHAPYPGFAIDRHWRLVELNATATVLLGQIGIKNGDSLLDAAMDRNGLRTAIVNWHETARYFASRLRTESRQLGGDAILSQAADTLSGEMADRVLPDGPVPAVLHTHYKAGEIAMSFYSTLVQFGTAEDIALADLRIELLFPSDENTRAVLHAFSP